MPGLGLILSIIYQSGAVAQLLELVNSETWSTLTSPGSDAYHPLWAPLLIFELNVNISLITLETITAVYFMKGKRILPRLMIVWLSALLVTTVADQYFSNLVPFIAQQPTDPSDVKALARSIVGCVVWIPYFLRSKRVKATFVN